MTRIIRAVFENGVLRPLEPLPFREHEVVDVAVSRLPSAPAGPGDAPAAQKGETLADGRLTLDQVQAGLTRATGPTSSG